MVPTFSKEELLRKCIFGTSPSQINLMSLVPTPPPTKLHRSSEVPNFKIISAEANFVFGEE